MFYKILLLSALFVALRCDVPKPLFDSGSDQLLPIYTNTYYAITNVWTGTYLTLGYRMTTKLDIFEIDNWIRFEPTDIFEPVQHVYVMYNQAGSWNTQGVRIYLDKRSGTYNIFGCSAENNYCQDDIYNTSTACWLGASSDGSEGFGYCEKDYAHGTKEELYWRFSPALDVISAQFDIYAKMTNFTYTTPPETDINEHKKVGFLKTMTFRNCESANQTQTFTIDNTTTEVYSLEIDSSYTYSSQFCAQFKISSEVGAHIFNIDTKVSSSTEIDFEIGEEYKKKRSDIWTTVKQLKISAGSLINIPPNQCITCEGYYSFIGGLQVPYTANVLVQIEYKDGLKLNLDKTKIIAGYLFQSVPLPNDTALIYETKGSVTSTFGLDVDVSVNSHGHTCNCSEIQCNIGKYSLYKDQELLKKMQITKKQKSCRIRKLIDYLISKY